MKNLNLEKSSLIETLVRFLYNDDILEEEGLRANNLLIQSGLKRSSCNNSIWVLTPSTYKK